MAARHADARLKIGGRIECCYGRGAVFSPKDICHVQPIDYRSMADTTQPAMGVLNRRDWQFVMAFSALALIGVGSGLVYVMSRRAATTSSPAVAAAPPVPTPAPSARAEPDAGTAPTLPSIPAKAAAGEKGPIIEEPAVDKPAAVHEAAAVDEPAAAPPARNGQLYVQIAAGTRKGADELLAKMMNQGYTGRVAAGPDEQTFRVLIGPAADFYLLAQLKRQLDGAGYPNFIRKYDEESQSVVDGQ